MNKMRFVQLRSFLVESSFFKISFVYIELFAVQQEKTKTFSFSLIFFIRNLLLLVHFVHYNLVFAATIVVVVVVVGLRGIFFFFFIFVCLIRISTRKISQLMCQELISSFCLFRSTGENALLPSKTLSWFLSLSFLLLLIIKWNDQMYMSKLLFVCFILMRKNEKKTTKEMTYPVHRYAVYE